MVVAASVETRQAQGLSNGVEDAFKTRALEAADQSRLWHWLHLALWDPPPAPLRPREVLDNPGVAIYAEGWGREGDVGVVGEVDGKPIGACWMRLIPAARDSGTWTTRRRSSASRSNRNTAAKVTAGG
jgi:hypothetical protein